MFHVDSNIKLETKNMERETSNIKHLSSNHH